MTAKQKQVLKAKAEVETKTKVDTKTKQSRETIVREAIKESMHLIDSRYVDLASLLSEAYHKGYHKNWGYDEGVGGWKDYCVKELDIHHRKAYYFIEIHDKMKALDLNAKEFEKLGWSKMKEIVSVMTTKNAETWLKKAREMSVRDLTEAVKLVRRKMGKGKGDGETITTMKLQMDESQMRIVTDAIEEGKGLLDTDNAVQSIVMICQDWTEFKGVSPTVATLDDHVKFLEKQFGVAISYKKVGKSVTEKAKEKAKEVSDKKADEKKKVVEKVKKKAAKEGKKAASAAADDMDDILGGKGDGETDDDINDALDLGD